MPKIRRDGIERPVDTDDGYAYDNPDTGWEWSWNHPVRSGEVPDATHIKKMTFGQFRQEK